MSFKVLVADDSLTIQKVIGITLANSGYELVECLNENDLLIKVKNNQYDLVLLDFNLSDTKTGYDLSKLIKEHQKNTPILILLGTFDTIEESRFDESGISDKIVKPFESSKFIKKCKQLIEEKDSTVVSTNTDFLDEKPTTSIVENDNLDSWVLDAPKKVETVFEELDSSSSFDRSEDPLENEIQGWGFNSNSSSQAGPSVIGDDDFPNITMPEKIEAKTNTIDSNVVLSKLQSASNFNIDDDDDVVDDSTDPHMTISDEKREILEALEEDLSPDSFWAVDDVQPVQSEETFRLDTPKPVVQEITADLTETLESFKSQENKHESNKQSSANIKIDEDKIIRELKDHLTPLIEKWVKEACKETVEKVSWDVIPDLAENLIRKELKELSDSVRH